MTTIYNYHPDSGEYLSQSEAGLDPLERKPLIPAFATNEEPPATDDNEVAVFKRKAWSVLADYRGTQYWLADGTSHTIEVVGEEPPTGALDTPPEPTLDELKAQTVEQVVAFASNTRAQIAGQVDAYKLAGWVDKARRAPFIIANTASVADIAIVQTECDRRGKNETPAQLAQKQVDKAESLATAVAIIDGLEATTLEAIETATSDTALATLLQAQQTKTTNQLPTKC